MNYIIFIIVAIVGIIIGSYFGVQKPSKLLKKLSGQERGFDFWTGEEKGGKQNKNS